MDLPLSVILGAAAVGLALPLLNFGLSSSAESRPDPVRLNLRGDRLIPDERQRVLQESALDRAVRPAIKSGRPTWAAMSRSNKRSSMGSAWFFSASDRKSACSLASFSGCFAAKSFVKLKSLRVSYRFQMSSASGRRGVDSHGALWMVLASQPSWYMALFPNISKYATPRNVSRR